MPFVLGVNYMLTDIVGNSVPTVGCFWEILCFSGLPAQACEVLGYYRGAGQKGEK